MVSNFIVPTLLYVSTFNPNTSREFIISDWLAKQIENSKLYIHTRVNDEIAKWKFRVFLLKDYLKTSRIEYMLGVGKLDYPFNYLIGRGEKYIFAIKGVVYAKIRSCKSEKTMKSVLKRANELHAYVKETVEKIEEKLREKYLLHGQGIVEPLFKHYYVSISGIDVYDFFSKIDGHVKNIIGKEHYEEAHVSTYLILYDAREKLFKSFIKYKFNATIRGIQNFFLPFSLQLNSIVNVHGLFNLHNTYLYLCVQLPVNLNPAEILRKVHDEVVTKIVNPDEKWLNTIVDDVVSDAEDHVLQIIQELKLLKHERENWIQL